MFRRRFSQRVAQNVLTPAQNATLKQAVQLIGDGKAGEAAPIFARLAQETGAANHPRVSANLHAQAAHAYADSQNEAQTLIHARSALALFIQFRMIGRTPRFYSNITRKLRAQGMGSAADELQKEFSGQPGIFYVTQPNVPTSTRGRLPPACTQCGAPLRSNELEWIDDHTVECDYCGALIQTQT
jgi:hypothetical protein